MSNGQDVFSFELNESLFFEEGQEVSEMVSISLDPEISIQSFNEYVSVRGKIQLKGEYQKTTTLDETVENTLNFEDHYSRRYLEVIEDTLDGKATFSHGFPVEISVPSYRVADMNDISVSIESFDYDIQSESHMGLTATINIHGINSQKEEVIKSELAKSRAEKEQAEVEDEVELETFEFEILKDELPEVAITEDKDQVPLLERAVEFEETEEVEELEEFEQDSEVYEAPQAQREVEVSKAAETKIEAETPKVTEVKAESKAPKVSEEKMESEILEKAEVKKEAKAPEVKKEIIVPEAPIEKAVADLRNEEDIAEPEAEEVVTHEIKEKDADSNAEEVPKKSADVTYLADMFRDKEDKERYSSMRICIVQDKDTIESIAARYQISAYQLSKQNELEDDNLLQGQLLSIPFVEK